MRWVFAVARGVHPESSAKILQARRQTEAALEQYMALKAPAIRGGASRLTDLLMFVIGPLQAIAQSMAEDMLISKVIGLTHLDKLMEELILIDDEPRSTLSFTCSFKFPVHASFYFSWKLACRQHSLRSTFKRQAI